MSDEEQTEKETLKVFKWVSDSQICILKRILTAMLKMKQSGKYSKIQEERREEEEEQERKGKKRQKKQIRKRDWGQVCPVEL